MTDMVYQFNMYLDNVCLCLCVMCVLFGSFGRRLHYYKIHVHWNYWRTHNSCDGFFFYCSICSPLFSWESILLSSAHTTHMVDVYFVKWKHTHVPSKHCHFIGKNLQHIFFPCQIHISFIVTHNIVYCIMYAKKTIHIHTSHMQHNLSCLRLLCWKMA